MAVGGESGEDSTMCTIAFSVSKYLDELRRAASSGRGSPGLRAGLEEFEYQAADCAGIEVCEPAAVAESTA
jgi:hypothetical protein